MSLYSDRHGAPLRGLAIDPYSLHSEAVVEIKCYRGYSAIARFIAQCVGLSNSQHSTIVEAVSLLQVARYNGRGQGSTNWPHCRRGSGLLFNGSCAAPSTCSFLQCASCLQDTVTGFLLAGVGNIDVKRKTNFLVVDSSTLLHMPVIISCASAGLAANPTVYRHTMDVAETMIVLFAGTTTRQIEASFKEFTQRDELGIILISQYVRTFL